MTFLVYVKLKAQMNRFVAFMTLILYLGIKKSYFWLAASNMKILLQTRLNFDNIIVFLLIYRCSQVFIFPFSVVVVMFLHCHFHTALSFFYETRRRNYALVASGWHVEGGNGNAFLKTWTIKYFELVWKKNVRN